MRTELSNRTNALATNALASSIMLVCRERNSAAKAVTRREFVNALKTELPPKLHHMQAGCIAPVDLAQAAIGSGMVVFTIAACISFCSLIFAYRAILLL